MFLSSRRRAPGVRGAVAARPSSAFTLVETLLVLGIVVVLTALTTSAAVAAVRRLETRRTEITCELLDLAVESWELAADRKLTWGAPEDHFDIWKDRAFPLIISEVLETIVREPGAREIVARIEPESIYTYVDGEYPEWVQTNELWQVQKDEFNGQMTVLDAWGTPIYSTHPGSLFKPGQGDERDDDGTIRTHNEDLFGSARNRRMCFVSAGPDRLFGVDYEDLGYAGRAKARRDNVYSYLPIFRYH